MLPVPSHIVCLYLSHRIRVPIPASPFAEGNSLRSWCQTLHRQPVLLSPWTRSGLPAQMSRSVIEVPEHSPLRTARHSRPPSPQAAGDLTSECALRSCQHR